MFCVVVSSCAVAMAENGALILYAHGQPVIELGT